ncbi:hypothetical protein ACWC09_08750 [Streptomyces sp. NPDC001617]
MTWPAALPAAALRVMRTAAGRRALQVVVLVGGLFALGFLCGEQAHAAEGAPVASSPVVGAVAPVSAAADGVGSLVKDTVGGLVKSPPASAGDRAAPPAQLGPEAPAKGQSPTPARPTDTAKPKPTGSTEPTPAAPAEPPLTEADPAGPAARTPAPGTPVSTTEHRTHPVTEILSPPDTVDPVLGPLVGQVVQSVDHGVLAPVGGLVKTVTDELAEATAQIPPLSSLPTLPGVPSVPSLPGLPAVPGQTLPVTQPDAPGQSAGADGGSAEKRSAAAADGAATGATYGPRLGEVGAAGHASARGDERRAVGAGYAPARQAPGGDPNGALGNRSAVDNGTPRHGDAHAVALGWRVPLSLLLGAAARSDADATRDRHPDIPVSPA